MPGYVIHIAVAKEYAKKHKDITDEDKFILGTIAPDLTDIKKETHYGKSPAYTSLKEYLKVNKIEDNYNKGFFLHLVTDYLFYNYYLDYFEKPTIYNDYDKLNKKLIEKYNVKLPENIKDKVFFIEGKPKILSYKLINRMIEEISDYNLEELAKEVLNGNDKWKLYKKLV